MESIELRHRWWGVAMQWGCGCSFLEAHTSGSTGSPKEILLPREAVRLSALRTNNFFSITSSSLLHSCISPEFIGGKMMMIRALESGAKLTYEVPSNRPTLLAEVTIDLLSVVPSMMHSLLARKRDGSLPNVRNILIGGSSIPANLKHEIAESGLTAYESYGMTETCSHIALRKIELSEKPFKALDGINITTDSRNCLVITIPGIDNPIVTNDIVELTSDGFRILGRADNVIVTGGRKVYPEAIEHKIGELTDEVFIIAGRKSEFWGEEVIVWFESDCVPEEIIPSEDFISELRSRLAPWEMPKRFYRGSLPLTSSGKPKRNALPFPDN